jgi:hypothetical protein
MLNPQTNEYFELVFGIETLGSLAGGYQCFGETCSPHPHGRSAILKIGKQVLTQCQ